MTSKIRRIHHPLLSRREHNHSLFGSWARFRDDNGTHLPNHRFLYRTFVPGGGGAAKLPMLEMSDLGTLRGAR